MDTITIINIAIKSSYVVLALVLLALCFWKRNSQPLKSRGSIPFIILIALIIIQFVDTTGILRSILGSDDKQAPEYCVFSNISVYLVVPCMMVISFLVPLQQLRYIFIRKMNTTMKQLVRESLRNVSSYRWYQRVSSTWFVLILLCVFCGIYLIAAGVSHIISFAACLQIHPVMVYALFGILIFVIFVGLLFYTVVVIVDTWTSNFMLFKCQWKKYFIDDDPFYFRIDMLFYTLALFWEIFGSYATRLVLDDISQNKYPVWWLIQWVVAQMFGIPYVCGNSLIVAIVRDSRKTLQPIASNEIEQMLNDQDTKELFKQFCKRELSIENLLIYEDIVAFTKRPISELKSEAQRIYETYLKPNAPLEINTTREVSEQVLNQLKIDKPLDHKLFDQVLSMVFLNLSDTMRRFKNAPEYLNFLQNKETMRKLMRQSGIYDKPKEDIKK